MIRNNATLTDLKTVEVTLPVKSGQWYQPLSHAELTYNLLTLCALKNWKTVEVNIGLTKDKKEMACAIKLTLPDVDRPIGFGIVNSNTGHKRLRVYFGVYDNDQGVVIDLYPKLTRHTVKVKITHLLDKMLSWFAVRAHTVEEDKKKLNRIMVTKGELSDILIRAGRRKLMPWSRLGKIDAEFRKLTNKSRWNLLLTFAKVVKRNPPTQQMEQMGRFYELLTSRKKAK